MKRKNWAKKKNKPCQADQPVVKCDFTYDCGCEAVQDDSLDGFTKVVKVCNGHRKLLDVYRVFIN